MPIIYITLKNCYCEFTHAELTIDDLKIEMKLTDEQLNTAIKEPDLPEVSACFDNTDDYLEKLELSPGQKTDVSEVKAKTRLNRTQAGMKLALEYWLNKNQLQATFQALLLILLSLLKGDVAVRVCEYLSDKCELQDLHVWESVVRVV